MSSAQERSERSVAESAFTVPLFCPGCGQTGSARYERNAGNPEQKLPASSPIQASDGFYLRVNINRIFNMQIVCEKCGKVHRGPVR